ncbi:MAG TPA: diadenylate cyclase CdaA [Pyrinomonadaceae bacterium]|jgi:diadenylate cyclase|nr:diadenylate cyclase CdaA [Pyrinomonadaceae bacterium]
MFQQSLNQYLESVRQPRNLVDIALVFLLVYSLLRAIRGTRAAPMAAGLGALALLYLAAVRYDLSTLETILRLSPFVVSVAVVVLFQNEIRQALIHFGNRFRMPFLARHRGQFGEGVYDEIVLAATTLASTKTGALIVIERGVTLRDAIEGGVKMDAELTYDLLVTIFNTEAPLHDGAVIISGHRVAAAACFLPLTLNRTISKDLGTRHRAAIGITEDTDAISVVVSEETGLISFVQGGQITRGLDGPRLLALIQEALGPSPSPRGDAAAAAEKRDETEALQAEVRARRSEVS